MTDKVPNPASLKMVQHIKSDIKINRPPVDVCAVVSAGTEVFLFMLILILTMYSSWTSLADQPGLTTAGRDSPGREEARDTAKARRPDSQQY
jgi:hypothetical protein